MPADHLRTEDIAAYLNGALSSDERHSIEGHLGVCRTCREEVTRARRLLYTSNQSRRRWLIAAPAVAAAAAVAFVLFLPRDTTRIDQQERSAGRPGETVQLIEVVSPADGETLRPGNIVFTWRLQPGNPLYRLSLTDATGREIWSSDTRDTTVVVPRDLTLGAGTAYLWYVDALDVSGRSVTSGTLRFRTAR